MKKILIALSFFLSSTFTFAQVPDEKNALLEVVVTDFEGNPLKGETVILKGKTSGKEFSGVTPATGSFKLLLPKGDVYQIRYLSFIEETDYSEVEIPNEKGIMQAKLTVQMESESQEVYELDIHFETAKSVIRPESFPLLDRLAEQMKNKPGIQIELGGHTDSDGDEATNLRLSQSRADEVKNYLVKKGISAERIGTKGYGESKPVASNETPEGKASNRRTEVRVTRWK